MIFKFCPLCGASLKQGILNNKKREYCPECEFINYKNPLPSAGIIAIREGKVLLIKRGIEPGKGFWVPPSGFVESGETPEDACLRELKEETGMTGEVKKIIGTWLEKTETYGDVIVMIYLVEIKSGELKPGDDAEDARFFELEKTPDLHFDCFKKAMEKVKCEHI